MQLATPVRLMIRPFRVYRELARGEAPSYLIGAARLLFSIGAFVSITATGRLAPLETLSATVAFSWLPLSHAIATAVTLRVLARNVSFARAYGLFLEGVGPWLLVFSFLSGACLFAPQPARPVFSLLFPLLVVGSVWSVVILFALFRAALEMPRARAALATALFYVVMLGFVIGYYFAMGQLWPVLAW